MFAGRVGVRKLSTATHYDVVVVGGGLVGNAVAASLGSCPAFHDRKILVLEASRPASLSKTPPINYSNRVSAVSPQSVQLFQKLGIWDRLKNYRVQNVKKLQVLDSCSRAHIEFDRDAGADVAFIVENDAIVGCLNEKLDDMKNVKVRSQTKLDDCQLPIELSDLAILKLEGAENITTSLVVGADGFRSRVRESMGVDYTGFDYGQMGIVATLKIQPDDADPENNVAWQRFTNNGPIALLPLSSELSSLVWTTSPEEAERLKSLPADSFVDELNHALTTDEHQNSTVNKTLFMVERLCAGNKISTLPPHVISLQSDTRAAFPLGFGHAHSYVCTRACVLGDAAHRVHPLAGQGVNMGWSDAIHLTNALQKALSHGADIGSVLYLHDYEDASQRHNLSLMVTIDWLNRLYRTDASGMVLARSLGLSAVNSLLPVKDFMMHFLSKNIVR